MEVPRLIPFPLCISPLTDRALTKIAKSARRGGACAADHAGQAGTLAESHRRDLRLRKHRPTSRVAGIAGAFHLMAHRRFRSFPLGSFRISFERTRDPQRFCAADPVKVVTALGGGCLIEASGALVFLVLRQHQVEHDGDQGCGKQSRDHQQFPGSRKMLQGSGL